jgi:hypothetical protein
MPDVSGFWCKEQSAKEVEKIMLSLIEVTYILEGNIADKYIIG